MAVFSRSLQVQELVRRHVADTTQEALDLGWYTPEEVMSEQVRRDMTGGHDRLIRLALAHVGLLP